MYKTTDTKTFIPKDYLDSDYGSLLEKIFNVSNYKQKTENHFKNYESDIKWEFDNVNLKIILPGLCIDDVECTINGNMFVVSTDNKEYQGEYDYLVTAVIPHGTYEIKCSMINGIFNAEFITNNFKNIDIVYEV